MEVEKISECRKKKKKEKVKGTVSTIVRDDIRTFSFFHNRKGMLFQELLKVT